jgi:hypothetical protein
MRRWSLLGSALAGSSLLAHTPLLRAADDAPSAAAALAVAPETAAPLPAEPERQASEPAPAQRRSGLVLGIAGGLLTSSARGYPNDVAKIDVPQYEAHVGAGVALGGAFWLGGALADWLTIGLGAFGGGSERGGLRGSGGAFTVRIEAFPLFYRGGHFQDLGVLFTAGTGGYTIHRGKEKLADGAGTSAVGLGAFYEPWRLWQLSFGPQIEYSHQFSDSMSAHTLVLGMRSVFYGGP